jgi:hypothetical protein
MTAREERLTEPFRGRSEGIHACASWRVGYQDASDVVGEVFLVAWRSLDQVRAGQEQGWLFGVARKLWRLWSGIEQEEDLGGKTSTVYQSVTLWRCPPRRPMPGGCALMPKSGPPGRTHSLGPSAVRAKRSRLRYRTGLPSDSA